MSPTARARTIVALGGGGFQMEPDNPLLDDYILELARKHARDTGRDLPRICLIPTATGDDREVIAAFERLFAPPRAEARVLRLFGRTDENLAAVLRMQDAVYVLGGSTENMLALWRLHGLDAALRDAWEEGVVLAGMSAGAICWFDAATTDSFGPTLQPLRGGLGILEGTFIPHLHGEAQRLPLLRRLVAEGTIPPGYGVDDGAALVFGGRDLVEVVTSDPGAGAWRVESDGHGGSTEVALPARFLGNQGP